MEYFSFLPIIIILVLLIILVKRLGDVSGSVEYMKQSLSLLERDLRQLKDLLQSRPPEKPAPPPVSSFRQTVEPTTPVAEPAPPVPEIPASVPVPPPPVNIPAPPPVYITPIPAIAAEPVAAITPEPADAGIAAGTTAFKRGAERFTAPPPPPVVTEPQPGWWDRWLSRNPDLEKFIGENLINKIGIAILVLGIAFFVKYAIDQDWINEIGRVSIGLLCGGILVGLAHRLRRNYRPFSSVLAGGGITVLYFTIAFAFHQYHLFTQPVAFVLMVVITAFAIALSVLYDRLELGILATLGGFITPFLVSRGDGNYIALFTYLVILNAGLIALAYYKKWRVLNFIAFFFTVIIYGGWIQQRAGTPSFSYSGTFLFGTVFYVMFIVMNLLYHVVRSGKLKVFDGCILFSINLAYYSAGYYLLTAQHLDMYAGLFTAALGLFNLVFSYTLFKRKTIDRNFVFLLIGLTLSFISLAVPVQLSGNYITLFWAAEMAVLLWLYQKSGITLVKIASGIISLLVLISLMMDWAQIYGGMDLVPVVINKGLITSVVVALALVLTAGLMGSEAQGDYLAGIPLRNVQQGYRIAGVAVLFLAGLLEVRYQFVSRYQGQQLAYIYLQLYCLLFAAVLLPLLRLLRLPAIPASFRLLVPGLLFFFYLVNTGNVYEGEQHLLLNHQGKGHFAAHWLSVLLLLGLVYNTINFVRHGGGWKAGFLQGFACVSAIAAVVILSIEIQHIYVWLAYREPASIDRAAAVFEKAGLSILWGIASFVLIWLGMRFRFKALRILALTLFGITILKLFFFDLRNISQGGKIAAFILLGAILLTVSFMYQRLKKIIIDDQPAEEKP